MASTERRAACIRGDVNRRLMRLGLVVLSVPALYTGLWAVVDPRGFFRSYPGFGYHWTSQLGPFNEHLTSDTGAGFIAIGIAVGYAAFSLERAVIRVSLVTYLAFSIPHLVFHLVNPQGALAGSDQVISLGLLAAAVALPLLLLALSGRVRTTSFSTGRTLLR